MQLHATTMGRILGSSRESGAHPDLLVIHALVVICLAAVKDSCRKGLVGGIAARLLSFLAAARQCLTVNCRLPSMLRSLSCTITYNLRTIQASLQGPHRQYHGQINRPNKDKVRVDGLTAGPSAAHIEHPCHVHVYVQRHGNDAQNSPTTSSTLSYLSGILKPRAPFSRSI